MSKLVKNLVLSCLYSQLSSALQSLLFQVSADRLALMNYRNHPGIMRHRGKKKTTVPQVGNMSSET